jgi:aldoxime dehydratase
MGVFELQYDRVVPARRPEGHQPAAPRYSLRWSQPHLSLVSVYFGMQFKQMGREAESEFFARIRGFLAAADGPQVHELMRSCDEAAYDNAVVVAYWTDPTVYSRWLLASGFREWFESRAAAADGAGYWFEPVLVPYDRHETIYSAPSYRIGFARTEDAVIVPITTNGFFGAARDRLPLSAVDALESPARGVMVAPAARSSCGGHWMAAVPHNATILRSGQFWEGAGQEQLEDYLEQLQPKLMRGMQHLVANRGETGCLSLRIMTNVNEDGSPRAETSVYATFLSLDQLERWAASHETHLDIYRHAIAMNRQHKEKREVVTWHELFVVQLGNVFEYINCHPATGILPYVRAMRVELPL